ncbi:MAG TPA: ROK family protein, partial [Dehalococcoidia bacterium]
MSGSQGARYAAAVDLGGTKILTVLLDGADRVVAEDLRETEAHLGPDAVLGRIYGSIRACLAAAGVAAADLDGIGVAVPGPVDFDRGVLTNPPNLPGLVNV